jgi:ubiquinone/menaquinone biosynthesis C-methylase UbiE
MPTGAVPAFEDLDSILQPGRLRLVDGSEEAGIWSVLDGEPAVQSYDSIAGVYDRIVGNRLYQQLVWGNDIERDTEFSRAAAKSSAGWWLDAGCGSLLFTAPVHAQSGRPTILFDLSIGMLQRARDRLIEHCGHLPEHVLLVQGDVLALPFRQSGFETILCPGIIHLFEKPAELLESLATTLEPGGGLYLSSLVTDRAFGARMLRLMQRTGETPNPIDTAELADVVSDVFDRTPQVDTLGNMAHVWLKDATR